MAGKFVMREVKEGKPKVTPKPKAMPKPAPMERGSRGNRYIGLSNKGAY